MGIACMYEHGYLSRIAFVHTYNTLFPSDSFTIIRTLVTNYQ
jgi:hypothetical protein